MSTQIIVSDNRQDTPYDLRQFIVDKETIRARPVEWDEPIWTTDGKSKSGRVVEPTKFEAACPYCGNMILFSASLRAVHCHNCGKGENINIILPFPDPFCEPGEFDLPIEINDILDEVD